jgi:hypothetical protein
MSIFHVKAVHFLIVKIFIIYIIVAMNSQLKSFFGTSKTIAQRLGNFLSKMIMPIIGAFIGFGLIATIGCYLPSG